MFAVVSALGSATANDRDPEGCIAVGTRDVQPRGYRPHDCYFVATGPVVYTAATTNPFVIAVLRGSWVELVRRPGPGEPTAGVIHDVAPGERISVSVSCWDYAASAPCADDGVVAGRFGVITAVSRP